MNTDEHGYLDPLTERVMAAIFEVSEQIAFLAGKIEGEQQRRGIKIPFQNLLIGSTALHLGYAVATGNPRHFQMIPGLVGNQF
jgi:predicted nucleic acid-binding protein